MIENFCKRSNGNAFRQSGRSKTVPEYSSFSQISQCIVFQNGVKGKVFRVQHLFNTLQLWSRRSRSISICMLSSVHSQLFAFLKNFSYPKRCFLDNFSFTPFKYTAARSMPALSTLRRQDRAFGTIGTIEAIQRFPYT